MGKFLRISLWRKIIVKQARILFVIHDVYQDVNVFPLGVGYLASVLRKEGYHVDIYCQDLYHYSNDELAEYLDNNDYDIIGIGFLAARFKETIIDLCYVVNNHKKKAWLILGGHGPSPIPSYVLRTTKADIVVMGESEDIIIEVVREKINKTYNLLNIRGIAYRYGDSDKIIINDRRAPSSNINLLPFPAWDLFPIEDYKRSLRITNQKDDEYSLVALSSRGCVNKCNFCYRMEKGIRFRSIDNFVLELKYLKEKYNINNFFFDDEMFVLNKNRLLSFEKYLNKYNLNINFFCSARVDIINSDVVKILKRCGCSTISIGLESLDDNVLKIMNKNTTSEDNIRAIETILEIGDIYVSLNFLWGNIGDTEEGLEKIVNFIKKYNTYQEVRTVRPPTPYPGSELYYESIRQGKLKGPDDFFNRFVNSDLYMINFTNIPLTKFYNLLLCANKELLIDYYVNTSNKMEECDQLINNFKDLYGGKNVKFRGSRKNKFKQE